MVSTQLTSMIVFEISLHFLRPSDLENIIFYVFNKTFLVIYSNLVHLLSKDFHLNFALNVQKIDFKPLHVIFTIPYTRALHAAYELLILYAVKFRLIFMSSLYNTFFPERTHVATICISIDVYVCTIVVYI